MFASSHDTLATRIEEAPRKCFNTSKEAMASMLALYRNAHGDTSPGSESHTLCEEKLEQWVESGLRIEERDGSAYFDPATTLNFFKLRGLRGEDSFWRDCVLNSARAQVALLASIEEGAPCEVSMRTTFFEKSPRPRRRSLALPFSTPLATIDSLVTVPDTAKAVGSSLTLRSAECPLILGYDARVRTRSVGVYEAPALTDEERGLYLASSEGLIQLTSAARDLVEEKTRGLRGGPLRDTVRRLRDVLFQGGQLGVLHYEQVGARDLTQWFLKSGAFDCFTGSVLLVTWARSLGIPARIRGGISLYPSAPSNHFWSEFHFDGEGWFPLDVAVWDLSLAGEDEEWLDVFFGRLDPRLVTHDFPTRAPGISALPTSTDYTRIARAQNGGCAMTLLAADAPMTPLMSEVSSARFPDAPSTSS